MEGPRRPNSSKGRRPHPSGFYAYEMNQYLAPREAVDDYSYSNSNFVRHHLESTTNELVKNNESKPSTVDINSYKYNIGNPSQSIKHKLHSHPFDDAYIHAENSNVHFNSKKVDYNWARYYADAGQSPNAFTRVYLENPPARQNTSANQYDKFPCSGGVKGPAQYFKPGSTVMVKWQIQNPIKDGKCIVRLSDKNEEDLANYKVLRPVGVDIDPYTGYFSCGNTSGNPEGVEIVIPGETNCAECVLQLGYKAPDFGEIYMCSDVSTVKVEGTHDCGGDCQNGGICFKGECVCAKGFYGKFCEQSTSHPGEYVAQVDKVYGDSGVTEQHRRNKKSNGINYLENTVEAEVPPDYYLVKETGNPMAINAQPGQTQGIN